MLHRILATMAFFNDISETKDEYNKIFTSCKIKCGLDFS